MNKLLITLVKVLFVIVLLTYLTYFMGVSALWLLELDYTFTLKHALGVTVIVYYLGFIFHLFGDYNGRI